MNNIFSFWEAVGGTAILSTITTILVGRKIQKSNEKKVEGEAEGQEIDNFDKISAINGREIERIEKRFKDQLEPLNLIINEQSKIINEQSRIIESQKKYIEKLESKIQEFKNP